MNKDNFISKWVKQMNDEHILYGWYALGTIYNSRTTHNYDNLELTSDEEFERILNDDEEDE